MRIVKDAAERKKEILDVSEKLFAERGFDNTSTNDIIKEIGIARGTLYHHFASKEDILDCIISRMTNEIMAQSQSIAADKSVPILDRFSLSIMALNIKSDIGLEVIEQVHKPQNALMHQKMQEQLLSGIVPIITGLVEEGIEAGIFHTDCPFVAVEMCMLYSNIAFDYLAELTPNQLQNKINGFVECVERLLGCEPGMLRSAILKIFRSSGNMTV